MKNRKQQTKWMDRLGGKLMQQLLLAALFAVAPHVTLAVPIPGAPLIVASDGDVVATYLGHSAGFSSDLYLDSPANALGIIFNNHASPVGSMVNLGPFTAGTELVLRIHVNDTGDDFFTGLASRNPDNVFHAVVDDAFGPNTTYVGFEDLLGGGDLDYDDLRFSFSNTRSSVPEPATLLLLGSGLTGLFGAGWLQRKQGA